MSVQEIGAFLLLGLAAAYLLVRFFRRRSSATCCGERTCPAAKALLDRIPQGGPPVLRPGDRKIHPKTR